MENLNKRIQKKQEQVKKTEERLKKYKEQLKEYEKKVKEKKVKELLETITAKGLNIEEAVDLIDNKTLNNNNLDGKKNNSDH